MVKLKWFPVSVILDDGDTFTDKIEAETVHQAKLISYWNWEYAESIHVHCQ